MNEYHNCWFSFYVRIHFWRLVDLSRPHFSYALHFTLPQYIPVAVLAGFKRNWNNFLKICDFFFFKMKFISLILTFRSFVTTAAGSMWTGLWANAWFSVTQIWATNASHTCALRITILQTFRGTWWHLRAKGTFTEICNHTFFCGTMKKINS